jgi:hypothetical protein
MIMMRMFNLAAVIMLALPLAARAREPDPALGAAPGVERGISSGRAVSATRSSLP